MHKNDRLDCFMILILNLTILTIKMDFQQQFITVSIISNTTFQLFLLQLPLYLEVDCANINIGDIGFCNCAPCFEDEGDCDFHDECQENLLCGSHNCPDSPDFSPDVDCCWDESVCEYPDYLGDDFCDDGNNNEECQKK